MLPATCRPTRVQAQTASHLSDRILDFIFELVPQRLELFEVRASLGTVTATGKAGRRREVRSSHSLPLCASLPSPHSVIAPQCGGALTLSSSWWLKSVMA